jgi:hypothetical protein
VHLDRGAEVDQGVAAVDGEAGEEQVMISAAWAQCQKRSKRVKR